MIFRAELAAKIMVGEKTVTRRLCTENPRSPWCRQRCALRPGQTFAVQPGRGKPALARARASSVRREALGRLSDHEARREGFATAGAFERGVRRDQRRLRSRSARMARGVRTCLTATQAFDPHRDLIAFAGYLIQLGCQPPPGTEGRPDPAPR